MINYTSFFDDEAYETNTLIEMYEGEQTERIIRILDGNGCNGFGKRSNWRENGIIPRTRNIMQGIVNKSSTLFNKPPSLMIWPSGNKTKGFVDNTFNSLMYQSDWKSFFQNVCRYTRLLKTTVVLAERIVPVDTITENGIYTFNPSRGDTLKLTMLHQGNAVIEMNSTETQITALAYLTYEEEYEDSVDKWTYRLITPTHITDIFVDTSKPEAFKETVISDVLNPYGIIPAVGWYDDSKPRCGFWNEVPEDLLSFQDMYNLWLTDTANAMQWQMVKQLFTDSDIAGNPSNTKAMFPYAAPGHTEGGAVYNDLDNIGSRPVNKPAGLGNIVKLIPSSNGQSPTFDWKGPESDLKMLYDVMTGLIKDIASDWSVRIRTDGHGSASSGFQLVVEEIDNLTLRQTQAQYFQDCLQHLYQVLRVLYPELTDGDLIVEFAEASLPVNQKEQLDIWIAKINAGLATRRDYLINVDGLSEQEADQKLLELNKELINTINNTNSNGGVSSPTNNSNQ